jgi:tetratricopeptide (TPR) repeat protein
MIDGGLYYGKLGNFNKALELLSQAINVVDDKINRKEYAEFKEDPEDLKHIEGELLGLKAQAFYKRGWIYQEIGDVRKSEQDYASYDKIYSFLNMVGFKDYNAL